MTYMRLFSSALLVFSLVLLGCSKGNSQANARVSGKLTYKGQPIKGGLIQFHTADGGKINGTIGSDGTYSATDIPSGELIVTVETESINPAKSKAPKGKEAEMRMKAAGGQKPPPGREVAPEPSTFYTKIPEKYSNPKTSPLTVELKPGRQVKDFDLTD